MLRWMSEVLVDDLLGVCAAVAGRYSHAEFLEMLPRHRADSAGQDRRDPHVPQPAGHGFAPRLGSRHNARPLAMKRITHEVAQEEAVTATEMLTEALTLHGNCQTNHVASAGGSQHAP